jgi:hypothetical protein
MEFCGWPVPEQDDRAVDIVLVEDLGHSECALARSHTDPRIDGDTHDFLLPLAPVTR